MTMRSSSPLSAVSHPSRRQAIALFASAASTAASLFGAGRVWAQSDLPAASDLLRPEDGWMEEAKRLVRHVQDVYWQPDRGHYVTPRRYGGTVPVDNDGDRFVGHTLWSWCEALRMLTSVAALEPERWSKDIAEVFVGLERYYDPERKVYNAWLQYPGNVDSYSDDNAWLIMGLCEATRALNDPRFADRANEVMEGYVSTEWRDDDGPLGMRWGFRPDGGPRHNQRAAISASTSAVAALELAELGYHVDENRDRARKYLEWVEATCVDDEGLVQDGLQPGLGEDGGWGIETTRWSYNTGLFIIGNLLLHKATGDEAALARATRSADAAIDREGLLWDPTVTDPARRHLRDNTFFASHLLEALVMASEHLGDDRYRDEAEREAAFMFTYLRDPEDGLYFRSLQLWRIDEQRFDQFRKSFAGAFDEGELKFDPNAEERASRGRDGDRPVVKTLLASAAVARAYASLGSRHGVD